MKQIKNIRALVAEDDFMVRAMIRGLLGEVGYTVVGEAVNGYEAVEMTQQHKPDIVLMDIDMPGMDGIEATRRISEACPTPVVILTAYDTPDLISRAGQAGAGAYLVKLPNAHELDRAITIAISRFEDLVELRRLNIELDTFARTVAHHLKTPLALVSQHVGLLVDEFSLAEEPYQLISAIAHQTEKMSHIVDELLLLAGMRKSNIELAELNMGRIVSEVQRRLSGLILEYNAQIKLPSQWPSAMGHAPWVEEIWANYLSNAIKYGGKPPVVRLGATKRSDGVVRFWVRDNGLGLQLKEREDLFTPFTRLTHGDVPGYGLGLSIVKRIVGRLGGQVGIESDGVPGEGCLFYFTLPARSRK